MAFFLGTTSYGLSTVVRRLSTVEALFNLVVASEDVMVNQLHVSVFNDEEMTG